MDLDRYREQAQEFISKWRMEKYRHESGQKDRLEVEAIFREYEELWEDRQVSRLDGLHREANPDSEKRLRYLLGFVVHQALNLEVTAEDQVLANLESQEHVEVAGRSIPFHEATVLLANEPDRTLRREIHEKRLQAVAAGNEIRWRRLQKVLAKTARLALGSFVGLHQRLTRVNYGVLKTQLDNFLVASESYYSSHLERYATRVLAVRLEELEAWDAEYLFRGHAFDPLFPQDRRLSVLKRTLMGLGFDLKKQENLVIDAVERPSKSSRPRCMAVRVPQEVYLLLRPVGGMTDFLALMNKAGIAMHAGNISETEPFEYRYLGDPAVSETFGYLLQYLTLNPDWLMDHVKVDYEHPFRDFNQFRKLYLLRLFASRFLFELELYDHLDDGPDRLRERYASLLGRALHVPVAADMYLYDLDPPFHGTRYLRAWIFESEMRDILSRRYGSRWYSRPISGDFLREVWSTGFRYDCDELAQRIRNWGLSMEPITRDFQ